MPLGVYRAMLASVQGTRGQWEKSYVQACGSFKVGPEHLERPRRHGRGGGRKHQGRLAHGRCEPGVGSTVQASPSEVKIRFTERIQPVFSKIQVFAESGKEVDKRDVHLDRSDPTLLIVSLPRLGTGTYKVVWRVISIDTHVAEGNFAFHIR